MRAERSVLEATEETERGLVIRVLSDAARQQCLLGDPQYIIHPSVCQPPVLPDALFHPAGPPSLLSLPLLALPVSFAHSGPPLKLHGSGAKWYLALFTSMPFSPGTIMHVTHKETLNA